MGIKVHSAVFWFSIYVLCATRQTAAGQSKDAKLNVPRIHGGSNVKAREPYYFLARITASFSQTRLPPNVKPQLRSRATSKRENLCTGAIITNEWVVTAAHCLFDRLGARATDIKVTVGDVSPTDVEGREVTRTAAATVYPYYVHGGRRNDVAMLKLDTPVPFNRFVGPVKMTNNTRLPETGKEGLALGWGSKYSPEPLKPPFDRDFRRRKAVLKKAFVKTVSKTSCQRYLRRSGAAWSYQVTSSTFCYKGKNDDICFGNDGGPVIQKLNGELVLVGINSFSRNKDVGGIYESSQCDADVPTVATRVSAFYNSFIKPTVLGIDVLSPDYYDPDDD